MIDPQKQIDAKNNAYKEVKYNAYFGNGFDAGVKFAEQHYQSEKAELVEMLKELINLHDLGHEIGQYDKAKELIKKATDESK